MRDAPDSALDALDVAEGIYLGEVVAFLHREGLFHDLAGGLPLSRVASVRGYDVELLRLLLEFVAHRSRLAAAVADDRWTVAPLVFEHDFSHTIDMYIGGFGPCLRQLGELLREPERHHEKVDEAALAAAWCGMDDPSFPVVPQLLRSLGAGTVVDLGCGSGSMLVSMALADPAFIGIGVDINPAMCEAARGRVAGAGLSKRIRIVQGSVADVARLVPGWERDQADAVHCGSLLNAFFAGTGDHRVLEALARITDAFPGRPLLVADYYGRLGRAAPTPSEGRTLVHDLAQVLTGQGVPPPDLDGWTAIYAAAGAELIQAGRGHDRGVTWFVHLVRLRDEPPTLCGAEA